MRKKSKVVRSLMMVSQIGISMLVPIFLCLFFGVKLNEWFSSIYFVPIFLFLGMGAAFRNVYYLTKGFYAKDKKEENEKLAYIAEHINEHPEVCIKYFVPDERKSGGAIVEGSGIVKKLSDADATITLADGYKIRLSDIVDLSIG